MKRLSVVIVIVTYKTAELTIDCLRSIDVERKNNNLDIRVVVVDNCSGDLPAIENVVRANSWAEWISVVCAPKNGGFAFGNNFGIQFAQSREKPDYIHLLNPDTVLRAGAINELVNFLEANRSIGIAGSSFENLDGSDWPFAFGFPSLLSEIEEGMQLGLVTRFLSPFVVRRIMKGRPELVDWVPGASMMVRMSVIEATGGLDENYFLYFEETDFCFRARSCGFTTWYVPASRVMHIAGQSTKVTERDASPKRLPKYWFESRCRFFASAYGVRYAIFTDVLAVLARSLGYMKARLTGRKTHLVPGFIADLIRYSLIWPSNRKRLKIRAK